MTDNPGLQTLLPAGAALFLDLLMGDPVFPFHPVRLIGKLAEAAEKLFHKLKLNQTLSGILAMTAVAAVPLGILFMLLKAVQNSPLGIFTLKTLTIYFSLALKDLVHHGREVKMALEKSDLPLARKRVSFLITRNTHEMGSRDIVKAAIESLSENVSDSVIAPLFFAIICGAPGVLLYRTINTLDAMWGYKTRQYRYFGKGAAMADDILNFIPSRITGILICLSAPLAEGSFQESFRIMMRDHSNVLSPNAGYPEAAAAGVLGISLGGPGVYFGKKIDKKPMGDDKREPDPAMIGETVKLLYGSTFIFIILPFLASFFL